MFVTSKAVNMKTYLLLAIIIGILIAYCIPKAEQIIDTNFIDKDLLIIECKDDMSFIFDTGANETILYSDTIPNSFFHVSDIKAKDVFSNEYIMKRYYSFKTDIGGIENYFHSVVILPYNAQIGETNGIWGADIIDRFCWWIDFDKHRICNNYTPHEEADFVLTYHKRNNLYYTDITMGTIKLKEMLIDIGYTRSDFALPEKELVQMELPIIGTDTCYNMINIAQTLNRYEINKTQINGKLFKNIRLTDLSSKRLIGLPFFKRFSAIYINTKKKQIECWI